MSDSSLTTQGASILFLIFENDLVQLYFPSIYIYSLIHLLLDTEQLYFLSIYIYSLIYLLLDTEQLYFLSIYIYSILTYFLIQNNSISSLYISTPWYTYLLLNTEQLYFLSIYFYSRTIKICGILIKVQILENKKVVTFDILYIYTCS